MATVYRHLSGNEDDKREISLVWSPSANAKGYTIKSLLLSNISEANVTCDLFLRHSISYGTPRINSKFHDDDYYVFKNITIPVNTSLQVMELLGELTYDYRFQLFINIYGDSTNKLDAILNYEKT